METITMKALIAREGIRIENAWADSNPHMSDMPAGSSHWKCTLRNKHRRTMTVYFSQGPAICREPEAADVLDCLASDASGIENASGFEDWAGEYGFDADSRKAERIYKTCERQAENLKRFMGDEYETLLYKAERL